jgi:N-acetylneuraminate synthase
MQKFEIEGRFVGSGQTCFIIAEAGVNHNGDLETAYQMIDAAAAANASAVKFQTFKAEKLSVKNAPKADYQIKNATTQESHYEMLLRLELNTEAHRGLIRHCQKKGISFLSSPFDEESADLLERLDVSAFKIPSGEITNFPFLEHIARKNKPILLSTGMSSMAEVSEAVKRIRAAGNNKILLLQCVSNYPANPAHVNLRAMATMQSVCDVPVGYSDHTLGNEAAMAAVALGASVIEKHFTLDRNMHGPDHSASIEPAELSSFVRSIRIVESTLGDGVKKPAPSETNTRDTARKSLVAACPLPAGTKITQSMIAIRRPGTGLPPAMRDDLFGRTLKVDVASGTLLALEMFT